MLPNAADYRARARQVLPRGLFEYIDRGSEDELALDRIRQSLDAIVLRPSVLSGQDSRDLGTTLWDRRFPTPLIVAPTALAGLVAYQGEEKLVRAASAAGIPFCVSTQSISTIEAIRRAAPAATLWFQLYVWRERSLTAQLLERVRQADCECLVLTADTQMTPNREYNQRNGFSIPFKPSLRSVADMAWHPRWLVGVMARYLLAGGMPTYGHYPKGFRSPITRPSVQDAVRLETNLDWEDVKALRDTWPGKLIVKGILSVEDAETAASVGVDGIVVSAHGGRNLDCLPSPAACLPEIAETVSDRLTILADSGVRRGTDVLKYLALGADGVLTGRLPLWGLAAGGEEGASNILQMILREMDTAMGFLGVANISDIHMPSRWHFEH